VFLLVFTNRPAERPVEQAVVESRPPASVPGNPRGATAPTGTAPKSAGRESRRADGLQTRTGALSRRPDTEDRQVQAASIDTGEAIAIEPLTPIDPIGIAKLDTPQAATSQIAITPITIERIKITPLTPPSPQR
jgi:hypothetical protein